MHKEHEQDPTAAPVDQAAQASTPPKAAEGASAEASPELNTDWKDKYIRLYADFDNYKKRLAREQGLLASMAAERMLLELLPVVDDFERALPTLDKDTQRQKGLLLIYSKLQKLLTQQGVTPIQVGPGDAANPEYHETLTQMPTDKPEWEGKVVEVVEKGYRLHGKVIRVAKVILGTPS